MDSDAAEMLINLMIAAVFGGITAAIASSRGRSAVGWFFIGFFLSCIGLILVLVLPDLKQQEERERRLAKQNRRLREQVEKERAIADRRHEETRRRIGVHDQALGVDTEPTQALETASAAPPPLAHAGPVHTGAEPVDWHYADNGRRAGPVDEVRLRQLWDLNTINRRTLVWTAGMQDWQEIGDLPDLVDRLT